MQFQGRIYKVFPLQTGTSASGKEWSRQDFIFEFFENQTDRYADRVLLNVMNERIREYDIQEGDNVIIGFGHTTREYQGRYFNDIRMYHFEKVKQVEQPAPEQPKSQQTQLFQQEQKGEEPTKGDLPF